MKIKLNSRQIICIIYDQSNSIIECEFESWLISFKPKLNKNENDVFKNPKIYKVTTSSSSSDKTE